MRTHEILPHIADARMRVTADSLEELFKGALEGMSEILRHEVTKWPSDPSTRTPITISAPDTTALLIDFLNEVLIVDLTEACILYDIAELVIKDNHARAVVQGMGVKGFDEDIKAVTYHGANIQKDSVGDYQVTVVFDI